MISPEKLRKIDPEMAHLSDEEIINIRQSFYEFGQLIFEDWYDQKFGSKNPVGLLTNQTEGNKI